GGGAPGAGGPPRTKPPVSTQTKARPACSARATTRSRVTPGASSTMARRARTMRLKSIDLPTFGRPTTTTTGNARRVASTRAAIARLQPELGQASGIPRPARLHADEQLEEDARSEQRLEPLARPRADVAQPFPLGPDDDPLVVLPFPQ